MIAHTLKGEGGSSPRMRGTDLTPRSEWSGWRFIPAHAGNSCPRAGFLGRCAVHPRACGEQRSTTSRQATTTGSSPRMRGTDGSLWRAFRSGRFIPAHAGNSLMASGSVNRTPVHPRACGEQFGGMGMKVPDIGSSPRMRGTGSHQRRRMSPGRFIPAHAGNSRACAPCGSTAPVHPRACGEQVGTMERQSAAPGSSPRMRGTVMWLLPGCPASRFIPAHAGNSGLSGGRPAAQPVHPRACGEQCRPPTIPIAQTGSSPRMRGTVLGRCEASFAIRFIPAHAGNSN